MSQPSAIAWPPPCKTVKMLLGFPTSIPTFVLAVICPLPAPTGAPSVSALLAVTAAKAPIAVELLSASEPASALNPTNVLLFPVVLVRPAKVPTAVLLLPVVFCRSAALPVAVL